MGNKSVLIKQFIRTNIRMAAAVAISLAVLLSLQSSAASINNSTNVLKVSPVRTDLQIKPGESKVAQTRVTNLTSTAIKVHPMENDFIAGDERGTPALILDEKQYAPTHSLKRFMKPLEDVVIQAGETKTIEVTISVPKDAQAGGYFGAVRFVPSALEEGGQVNMSASVASLVLLTVPGATVEKLNLTHFDIQQDGKKGTNFRSGKDIQGSFRFENKGNLQVSPFGKVSIKEGDKVVYEADFNDKTPRDMVLPDSARRWEVPFKELGNFGHYTVSVTFTYGTKNQTIEANKSFWIIPWEIIIGAVVALIVLIALIIGIWLFLRNYKRRILRKHSGGLRRH